MDDPLNLFTDDDPLGLFGEGGDETFHRKGAYELFPRLENQNRKLAKNPAKPWEVDIPENKGSVGGSATAALDVVGGIPGFLAGGARGLYTGITEGDPAKGLKALEETSHNYMPSTLAKKAGIDLPVDDPNYGDVMAPIEAMMGGANLASQGYGELALAAGASGKTANQVSDSVNLGLQAGMAADMGIKGYQAATKYAKSKANAESAKKLETPITPDNPLGLDIPPSDVGTAAHVDDYAAVNPYDVGGHVTEAEAGRPTTLDNPQGELFGGLKDEGVTPPKAEDVNPDSLLNDQHKGNSIEYQMSLADDVQHDGGVRHIDPDTGGVVQGMDLSVPTVDYPLKGEATDLMTSEVPKETPLTEANKPAVPLSKEELFRRVQERNRISDALSDFDPKRKYDALEDLYTHDLKGDSSKLPIEHAGKLFDLVKKGDLKGVLAHIGETHPNANFRLLANFLKDRLDGVGLEYHPGILKYGDRKIDGYFGKDVNRIGLSTNGALSPHAILHEAVHALSSQYLELKPNSMLSKQMNALYQRVLASDGAKNFNIYNVREFMAEAMSNLKFQEYLRSIKSGSTGTWAKFKAIVKDMLGAKDFKIKTALDDAMDLSGKIMKKSTFDFRKAAAEEFKANDIPNALADMMADKMEAPDQGLPKDPLQFLKDAAVGKGLGDFKSLDITPEAVIELGKQSNDIKRAPIQENVENGGIYRQVATKNPIVQYASSRLTKAAEAAELLKRKYLTDPETGLISNMRKLDAREKGEIWAKAMMVEGQSTLTPDILRRARFNEKQIAYEMKRQEVEKIVFNNINDIRAKIGMKPMDPRVGHIAGLFMGDFSRMAFRNTVDASGKTVREVVGRFSGNTKWIGGDLDRATKYIKERHPDWEIGPIEYHEIGKGKKAQDRFSGLMEVINTLGKDDPHLTALVNTVRELQQADARNFLNAPRHEKGKKAQAGGAEGSEGNKAWKDIEKNSEEGMKAQLNYAEQSFSWYEMQKASLDLGKVTGDKELAVHQPNAIGWAEGHLDQALGRGTTWMGDAVNALVSQVGEVTGIGHTNIVKGSNFSKHVMMQKLLGFGSIPFTTVQLLQPILTMPAMVVLMKTRGIEYSAAKAAWDSITTMGKVAFNNTFKGSKAQMTDFEKAAFDYAHDHDTFNIKLTDHTKDITQSVGKDAWDFVAEANIKYPEFFTRGAAFMFYAHALKNAGMSLADAFSTAANMTRVVMTDYTPLSRPKMFNQGLLGDVASTLTRFKSSNAGQLTMYAREAKEGLSRGELKSVAPLATQLTIGIAAAGVLGVTGYKTADALVRLISDTFGRPTSLTNMIMKSDMPRAISHGIGTVVPNAIGYPGVDMTNRLGTADLMPESVGQLLFPLGTAYANLATTGYDAVKHPNEFNLKRFGKELAPNSMTGYLENKWFSEKKDDGTYAVTNSRTGEGNYSRNQKEVNMRNLGFRGVDESIASTKLFEQKQHMDKPYIDKRKGVLDNAFSDYLSGSLDENKASDYAKKYVEFGSDQFARDLEQLIKAHKMTPEERYLMRNAGPNYTGSNRLKQYYGKD